MAHIIADRVREAAVVTDTGSFTLSGAVTNFEPFSDVMSNTDTCWYCAVKESGGWEVGFGTKASGVLQRTTVLQSSNADALVVFGTAATVDIFMVNPAINAFHGATTSKTTPVDADGLALWDSVAGALKRVTWANLKATLKAYFDALYEPAATAFGLNTQTASYTAVLADAGKVVEINNASANTFTIPQESSVAWAAITRIDVVQYGAGQTTIVAGTGVTIRSADAKLKLNKQYSGASLYKRATNEWVLIGDLTS